MKKVAAAIAAMLVLIVCFNILTREGSPTLTLPGSGGDGFLEAALKPLLAPGLYALWYLGFDADTLPEIAFATLLSWWAWLALVRTPMFTIGRAFGVVPTARIFHWWLKIGIPWRPPYRVWLRLRRWFRQFFRGPDATAAWTGVFAAMTLVFQPGDYVYLGRLWFFGVGLNQILGLRGPRHVAVMGGSGAGKTSYLKNVLATLHPDQSAFVIDCAAEIINALGAPLERAGHRVLNLDPYGLSKFPRACWNPIDELDHAEKRHGRQAVVRFAMGQAFALVIDDNEMQKVFATVARGFVVSAILYVWLFEPPEQRNLIRVREIIANGMPDKVSGPNENAFAAALRVMTNLRGVDDKCNGQIIDVIVRGAAGMLGGQRGNEGNPFRVTAIGQTAWLDIPEIAAMMRRSDFSCADLKTTNSIIFFCAPVLEVRMKIPGCARLLSMSLTTTFENMPGRMKNPSVFCLDETPALRIPDLDIAAPTVRKFGIRLIVISQDVELLRASYPRTYGGFFGNAMATLFMGTEHPETLELASKLQGTATYVEEIGGGIFSNVPKRIMREEKPFMRPLEVKEFLDPERGQMIVIRAGKPALRVIIDRPEHGLPVWAIDPDPDFPEPILRRLTRGVFDYLWLRKPPLGPLAKARVISTK